MIIRTVDGRNREVGYNQPYVCPRDNLDPWYIQLGYIQVSMENVFTPSEVKRVRSPSSTFSKHWCPHLGKVSKFWITIAEKHFLLRALARANVTYNTI